MRAVQFFRHVKAGLPTVRLPFLTCRNRDRYDYRMGLRKVLWQLRHPLSSPPWMTEEDEERDNREWEDFAGGSAGRGSSYGTSAGGGAAEDDLETEEAPPDPAP